MESQKRFSKIWQSDTAYGGDSFSATSDGITVNLKCGPYADSSTHRKIASISIEKWEDMLDPLGQPSFKAILLIAYEQKGE